MDLKEKNISHLPFEIILIIFENVIPYAKGVHTLLLCNSSLRNYFVNERLEKLKDKMHIPITEHFASGNPHHSYFSISYNILPNKKKHGPYNHYIFIRDVNHEKDKRICIISTNYKEGNLHGEFKECNIKGDITLSCNYYEGKLHGEWHRYNSFGYKLESRVYCYGMFKRKLRIDKNTGADCCYITRKGLRCTRKATIKDLCRQHARVRYRYDDGCEEFKRLCTF